jgi:hypothetical protein
VAVVAFMAECIFNTVKVRGVASSRSLSPQPKPERQ